MRPLGIPTVKDRIVQTAVKLVIEPIFESEFCGGATASDRDGAAKMHCAKSTACSRKASPSWWMPTWRATSTAIPHERLMRAGGGAASAMDACST